MPTGDEQKNNQRVVRVIGALVVAGALILAGVYIPRFLKTNDTPSSVSPQADRVEKTTRTFSGTVEKIDYENRSFSLMINPNPALYEGQDKTIFVTDEEIQASPWTIVLNSDQDVGEITQITKITPTEDSAGNPHPISSAASFDQLKEGDYVYALFWPDNYSFELKKVTPVLIMAAPPPGVK